MKTIGHRGMHIKHPENSELAIRSAIENGFDGVEVDVQMLGDSSLVLHHDPVIRRGNTLLHLATTTREKAERFTDHPLLPITELIEWFPTDKQLILECKPAHNPVYFIRRLRRIFPDTVPNHITFSSLDMAFLRKLHLRLSANLAPVLNQWSFAEKLTVSTIPCSEIHIRQGLCRSEILKEIRSIKDVPIIAWTVNEKNDVEKLKKSGLEGFMTDNPELLKR